MSTRFRTLGINGTPRVWVAITSILLLVPGLAYPGVYYYFDESSDDAFALDSGGGGVDLPILGGSARTTAEAKFGTGSLDLGPDPLMGFGSALTKGPFGVLGEEISRMTISLWMLPRIDNAGEAGVFMAQRLDSSGKGGFTFCYSGGRCFVFYTEGLEGTEGNAKVVSDPTLVWPGGEWVHVAMTFDAGTVTFYVNGEMEGSPHSLPDGVTSIASPDATVAVFSGMPSSPGIQCVDDFGFFGDEALSHDDIRAVYQKGLKAFVASRLKGTAQPSPASLPKK